MTQSPWFALSGFMDASLDPADVPDFAPGDVVRLIVGETPMVVTDYCEACGDVNVAWETSTGDVMRDTFPEEALVDAYTIPDCGGDE